MSTLDKIIEEILEQARGQADAIINGANEKAADIASQAQADRDEWKRQLDETAASENLERANRAESGRRQNRRRALLNARGQVIDAVIAYTKAKIIRLPDGEYSDFLFRLFEKNAQPLDGSIRVAPSDFARLRNDFLARCRSVFPENKLELSGDADGIENGFVIEYGNVIQNCSLDGIFEAEGQALRDRVNEVLTSGA